MQPSICILAPSGLMTRPMSCAATTRLTRISPVFRSTATSAAIAQYVTARPALAAAIAVALALLFTWMGLAVGYFTPYPVGFFITSFAFGTYVLVRGGGFFLGRVRRRHLASPRAVR